MLIKIFVSLIPAFMFLFLLLYLDSIKLVNNQLLLFCLGWGVVSSGLSYLLNTLLIGSFQLNYTDYSEFGAPLIEECFKFSLLWIFIKKSKIGFMIDGAIYGFSIGAAFSLVENLFYLFSAGSGETNLMLWIIRGFGTAVMHSGATAIFGVLCVGALNRNSNMGIASIYGALAAILLHAIFNQFLVSPILSTLIVLIIIPFTLMIVFSINENSIRNWLELEFDSEVKILAMIKKGKFSQTKTGSYLVSIKKYYPRDIVVDMYCYISLYLELSMKAKTLIMLKENGLEIPPDPTVAGKVRELKVLQQNIGRGGCLAIAPVLRMSRKDLWKLSLLA